jgi:MFS family permease
MVADMWEPDDQQYAVAFIVFSSVGGSVVGPVVGGFVETYLNWHWNFWIQLIFGGFAQAVHFICVPETRSSILVDRAAKRRRKAGQENIYGPGELKEHRLTVKEILAIWGRPFEMFFCEPIVLCLSLLSGFSDALIFTFLESYMPVFEQWGFSTVQTGLAFLPLLVGYLIAYFSFFPFIHRHRQIRKKDPDALQPEARLYWLLYSKLPAIIYIVIIYILTYFYSCTSGGNWTLWFRMDKFGATSCTMDCPYVIFCPYRHR